ncbi:MAG: 4-hydroxy-tetrahydrodipicolinate reductase [Clostridia bacterium]|nr:4-hydroxy-tetrahydrodipicolinate reductase [Clostridia bacterium]
MVNVLISGALGRMGKKVFESGLNCEEVKLVCGIDIKDDFSNPNFPIYDCFCKVNEKIDVIIDFSRPTSLDNILDFAIKNNCGVVFCTTGYTEEDLAKIDDASKKIAVFRSANMSLGVNVLIKAVKEVASKLGDFDIEITEAHHNKKVDAPSGTALMLADAVKNVLTDKNYVYGRSGVVGKRTKQEIGIHAIRGGNIVGDHQVMFIGENETITLSHHASDRALFADGAIKASIFLKGKNSGFYDMNDLLSEND